jgi:hypothetical protein
MSRASGNRQSQSHKCLLEDGMESLSNGCLDRRPNVDCARRGQICVKGWEVVKSSKQMARPQMRSSVKISALVQTLPLDVQSTIRDHQRSLSTTKSRDQAFLPRSAHEDGLVCSVLLRVTSQDKIITPVIEASNCIFYGIQILLQTPKKKAHN